MASEGEPAKRNQVPVQLPRATVDAVRLHLERVGARIGRPVQINQFFAEAARRLMEHDVDRLREQEDVHPGDEAAPSWHEGDPVVGRRRTGRE